MSSHPGHVIATCKSFFILTNFFRLGVDLCVPVECNGRGLVIQFAATKTFPLCRVVVHRNPTHSLIFLPVELIDAEVHETNFAVKQVELKISRISTLFFSSIVSDGKAQLIFTTRWKILFMFSSLQALDAFAQAKIIKFLLWFERASF